MKRKRKSLLFSTVILAFGTSCGASYDEVYIVDTGHDFCLDFIHTGNIDRDELRGRGWTTFGKPKPLFAPNAMESWLFEYDLEFDDKQQRPSYWSLFFFDTSQLEIPKFSTTEGPPDLNPVTEWRSCTIVKLSDLDLNRIRNQLKSLGYTDFFDPRYESRFLLEYQAVEPTIGVSVNVTKGNDPRTEIKCQPSSQWRES